MSHTVQVVGLEITRMFYDEEARPTDVTLNNLAKAEEFLTPLILQSIADHQRVALASLFADLISCNASGGMGIESSKLIQHVNEGKHQLAAGEFYNYVFVGNRLNRTLWDKRTCEKLLYLRGFITLPSALTNFPL